jgi:hypothetical protein
MRLGGKQAPTGVVPRQLVSLVGLGSKDTVVRILDDGGMLILGEKSGKQEVEKGHRGREGRIARSSTRHK